MAPVLAERQWRVPDDLVPLQRPIEMREKRAAARWLPAQRVAEPVGNGCRQNQVGDAGEMLRGRLGRLNGGGEVDEPVGEVDGRAPGHPRGVKGLPLGRPEDLVDQHLGVVAGPAGDRQGGDGAFRALSVSHGVASLIQSSCARSPAMLRTVLAACLVLPCAVPAAADFTLTILHTNDFHARFEPINRFDSTCAAEDDAAGNCFGGSARLATAIAVARADAEASILVDGGDQFQGTLFYTYYKGQATAEMMNRLGYDAMTVGNHEFDDGPEVLRGFMDAVDFPVLMSNADVMAEPHLADVLRKSTVLEVGGERIGLIGLTPENTDEIAAPGPNITFTAPAPAVAAEVARLERDGIDKIVVLSHSGYGVDLGVAESVAGIDVIVGGHSNTYLSNTAADADGPYPTMVGDTAVVQAYAYGKFLGRLQVTFDDVGQVIRAEGEPLIMDAAVTPDTAVAERIAALAAPLAEIRNRVVAQTAAPIDGERGQCRAMECEMGNLVAEAMLARVRDQGIAVALQNGGGLRASIDAGAVTMGEVLTVLPFQNTLSTFRISGATLRAALENGVSQVGEGAGRFPQVAGLRFAFDPSRPLGDRVTQVEIAAGDGWQPLDPDRLYGVVSNNFLRGGGDGYDMLVDAENAYDFGPDLADVTAEYLAGHAPYRPFTDGRIRIVD